MLRMKLLARLVHSRGDPCGRPAPGRGRLAVLVVALLRVVFPYRVVITLLGVVVALGVLITLLWSS